MKTKRASRRKSVLVTGANGFIGRAVAAELIKQGFHVICATRSAFQLEGADTLRIPDLEMQVDWSDYLAKVNYIIHTAAHVHHFDNHEVVNDDFVFKDENMYYRVNVRATLDLAQAAADNGVKRFIFLSTAKVNGESSKLSNPFQEDDTPNPSDSYSLSKFQAEEGLMVIAKHSGMEVVIIRPPLVYGPGVKANFAKMLNVLQKHIPLPLGKIDNKRSLVYVGNLVSFMVECLNQPKAANEVFFISDGHDVSTAELLRACAAALNIKAILLPVPQALLQFLAKLFGMTDFAKRLCGSLQLDISKAKRLLGWTPPFSMVDGLKATVGEGKNTGSEM